jgi:hypothetical protein
MPAPFFLHRPDLDDFILIHTMGKVGSIAMMRSLEAVDIFCRHGHWAAAATQAFFERLEVVSTTRVPRWNFFLQNRINMRRTRSALQDPQYAALIKVIAAIRAPLDQIVSNYFQSFPIQDEMLRLKKLETNAANICRSILQGVERYMDRPDRSIADLTAELDEHNCDTVLFCWLVHNYRNWFDEEFRPFFPVDILAGWTHEGFQIAGNALILKYEELSTHGERAIATYAQRPRFKMIRNNVGAEKSTGDLYREVVSTLKFPADFVDHLCDGPYVRHFYSEEERDAMRRKWTGK